MSRPRHSRFSPHLVDPGDLELTLVGRHGLLEQQVTETLGAARAGVGRYVVLTGPRGIGKSHLTALFLHRIAQHPARGELLIASLGEELHVSSLVDLLGRVLHALPEEEGEPSPASLLQNLRRAPREEQLKRAQTLLIARVNQRPLLLILENLDRILGAIGTEGQRQLRVLLQGHPGWSVFASSCTWGEMFTSSDAPFYNTFLPVPLKSLSTEQCHEMLRKHAELENDQALLDQLLAETGRSYVGAIRQLIGGNPRAMALIFPFLREGRLHDLEGAFLDLAEELTPYFQAQMAMRPPGQQALLERLAESWEPLSVSELAEQTYSTHQTTSGQLRYLKRDRLVSSLAAGRESYYEISEPLHRLAWAMKRPERAPVTLARFIQVWLSREEIQRRIGGYTGIGPNPWILAWNLPDVETLPDYLDQKTNALIQANPSSAAVEDALEMYRASPYSDCMGVLLLQLALMKDPRLQAFAKEALQRFEHKLSSLLFSIHQHLKQGFDAETLAQIRGFVASHGDAQDLVVLLMDATAKSEHLTQAAERLGCMDGVASEQLDRVIQNLALLEQWALVRILGLGAGIERLGYAGRSGLLAADSQVEKIRGAALLRFCSGLNTPEVARIRIFALIFGEDLIQAQKELKEALGAWPEDAELQFLDGILKWRHEGAVEAMALMQALQTKHPTDVNIAFFYALILIELAKVDEARLLWTQHLASPFWRPKVRLLVSHLLQHAQIGAAVEVAEMADVVWAPTLRYLVALTQGESPLGELEDLELAAFPDSVYLCWWDDFMARCIRDTNFARLEPFLSSNGTLYGLALSALCWGVGWTLEHNDQESLNRYCHFINLLDDEDSDLSPPRADLARWGRAILAIPTDIVPYCALPAAARQWLRELLGGAGCTSLLSHLPPEDPDA